MACQPGTSNLKKSRLQSKLACAQTTATERRNRRLQVTRVTSGGTGQTPRTNALEHEQ